MKEWEGRCNNQSETALHITVGYANTFSHPVMGQGHVTPTSSPEACTSYESVRKGSFHCYVGQITRNDGIFGWGLEECPHPFTCYFKSANFLAQYLHLSYLLPDLQTCMETRVQNPESIIWSDPQAESATKPTHKAS